MKRALRICLFLVFSGVLFSLSAGASSHDEANAIDTAERWLALVDSGRIDESWSEAASLFRNAVSRAQWKRALTAARGPLGALISRRLLGAQYTESLPGAPDGRYLVIQYEAEYEKKHSAIETITPMFEDGKWRVSGYYIR
jgi:hypothetical protein